MKIIGLMLVLMLCLMFLNSNVYAPPGPKREVLTNAGFSPDEIVKRVATIKGIRPKVLKAIWFKESSMRIWVDIGRDKEYSVFQIKPETGQRLCHGKWKRKQFPISFTKSAMCSASILLDAKHVCRVDYRAWNKYNTGQCLKKATGYAQDVQSLILLQRLNKL